MPPLEKDPGRFNPALRNREIVLDPARIEAPIKENTVKQLVTAGVTDPAIKARMQGGKIQKYPITPAAAGKGAKAGKTRGASADQTRAQSKNRTRVR